MPGDWSFRTVLRFLPGLLVLLTGCGPLPRPFQHEEANPLLEERQAMRAIAVLPVAELPGLNEAVAKALDGEDLAASTTAGDDQSLSLEGRIDGKEVLWQLHNASGATLAEVRQPVPASLGERKRFAKAVANRIDHVVRGLDSGLTDIEARPRVLIRPVAAPASIDGDGLAKVMARALVQHDIVIGSDSPIAIIEGRLSVSPGAGNDDLAVITWRVLDPGEKELAKISQSGPIPRNSLSGDLGQTGRDIAEAGAGAIAEVVRRIKSGTRDNHPSSR